MKAFRFRLVQKGGSKVKVGWGLEIRTLDLRTKNFNFEIIEYQRTKNKLEPWNLSKSYILFPILKLEVLIPPTKNVNEKKKGAFNKGMSV